MRRCQYFVLLCHQRTKCIIEGAETPLPYLNECIKELEMMNVEY